MRARNLKRIILLAAFLGLILLLFRIGSGGGVLPLESDRIGYIALKGVITTAEEVVDDIDDLAHNPRVRGLLVRVDSPGGAVAPSQEIHAALLRFQEEHHKPVVISMGNVAASGGYYIACSADRIVADPGTLTGSIGVIMHFTRIDPLLDRLGISSQVVKSGKYKDIGSPTRAMTDEERELLGGVIDSVYGQFVRAVAEGRDLPEARVRELADGRIFSGAQAQEAGLVDDLGGLRAAIRIAGELTDLGPTPELLRPQERGMRRLRRAVDSTALSRWFPQLAGVTGLCYLAPF